MRRLRRAQSSRAEYRAGKNQSGFSLIEIVITLVVLSIATVGVLSVFNTGIKGSVDPLLVGQATQLAQEKMDIIIGDRMNTAPGYGYAYASNLANYPAEPAITVGARTYSRAVAIDCVDAILNPAACPQSYARVMVTVSWNGGVDSTSATTLFTNY